MHTRSMELKTAIVCLSGTGVWAAIAVLAGLRWGPLGVIELLLLFAVLVVVPLGLELTGPEKNGSVATQVISVLQPFAALAVVVSFWERPGLVGAALSLPWFVFGMLVAASGTWNFYRNEKRALADLAVSVAGVDLAFAGGWLVVSRAGLHPMGFQEPIVLLTAVHFHYSGFAVATIAAAALRLCERSDVRIGILPTIVWIVLFLPFVLAAGFVISPALRVVGAVGLALSVPALAVHLFSIGKTLKLPVARIYLRTGAIAGWIAMALAGAYAVTDYAGRAFLTMPGMASTHGVLNGIGFVLFSMLAFLMEKSADELNVGSDVVEKRSTTVALRKPPSRVPSPVPDFVAREFYDR